MVKPQSLWALFKKCDDSKWLGDICRALGGQEIALSLEQRRMLDVLRLDNEWHTEAIEEKRRLQRERQARHREKLATQRDGQGAQGARAPVADVQKKNEPTTGRGKQSKADNVTVDLSKVDISDDAFFNGKSDAVLMARKVTGDMGARGGNYWRRWIREMGANGESVFLEELFQFKRELEAGETVTNRGAAFTQRLKKLRQKVQTSGKADE